MVGVLARSAECGGHRAGDAILWGGPRVQAQVRAMRAQVLLAEFGALVAETDAVGFGSRRWFVPLAQRRLPLSRLASSSVVMLGRSGLVPCLARSVVAMCGRAWP